MKELEDIFSQIFTNFSGELAAELAEKFTKRKYRKGDFFLEEKSVCTYLGFIRNGSMMCYYLKNGKRYIDEFSLENEFITDYSSLLTQDRSDKYIQCIEDTEVYITSYKRLQELYQKHSAENERLGRTMAEQLFLKWHEKSKSLLIDNATERYLKLIENRPQLPQRVPQYLIAEYLGITPESLSRIRKKRIS